MEALLEVGPSLQGPGGPVPITWQEMDSWADRTCTDLPGYEALELRQLSKDYCDQYYLGRDPNCLMPLDDVGHMPGDKVAEMRAQVANSFADAMRRLQAAQK